MASSRQYTIFWVILISVLVFFMGLPIGKMVAAVFTGGGKVLGGEYGPIVGMSLWNSVWVSVLSVVGAALVGTTGAYLVYRYQFPLRTLTSLAFLSPLALPPLVGTLMFYYLLNPYTGIMGHILGKGIGVTGFAGVLCVHWYSFSPYFFLFVSAALQEKDPSIELAARSLGASARRTFFTVTVPLLTPALLGAGILVFMSSMASYSAPIIFANDSWYMTVSIDSFKNTYHDNNGALFLTALLVGASLLMLVLLLKVQGAQQVFGGTKGESQQVMLAGGKRKAAMTLSVVLAILAIIPFGVILGYAFSSQWGAALLPKDITLQHFLRIFSTQQHLDPFIISLVYTLIATAGAVGMGILVAVIRRNAQKKKGLLELLVMVSWAIPGTALGVMLLETFGPGKGILALWMLLPLAYFLRFFPFAVRSTVAAIEQLDPDLPLAARTLGAGWLRSIKEITIPLIKGGVVAGAVFVLVSGFGEFVASVLLTFPRSAPWGLPGSQPASVHLFAFYQNDIHVSCAYATIMMIISITAFSGIYRLGKKQNNYRE